MKIFLTLQHETSLKNNWSYTFSKTKLEIIAEILSKNLNSRQCNSA